MRDITQERLKELLEYDPNTGVFRSKTDRGRIRVGSIVGSKNGSGYVQIGLDYKYFIGHRLAWFYMTGKWPKEIDHIDGQRDNNCFDNLRETTHAQNSWNRSHARGIFYEKHRHGRKWCAAIVIGKFNTEKEAREARMKAKRLLREFFIA